MHPYTTDMCNMKKPKLKLVRIRAWANMDEESGCDIITATNVKPKYFGGAYDVPVIILINKKYLKGEK